MSPERVKDFKWRLGIALALGTILALVLSASAAAAPPSLKPLGGKDGASKNVGSAAGKEGAHCRGGGSKAIIKARARLQNCDLAGANLNRAKLTSANLKGAKLTGAHLNRAHLFRADLTGANLTSANLAGATLMRANLTGAKLIQTDLTGADCWGAKRPDGSKYPGGDSANVFFVPC